MPNCLLYLTVLKHQTARGLSPREFLQMSFICLLDLGRHRPPHNNSPPSFIYKVSHMHTGIVTSAKYASFPVQNSMTVGQHKPPRPPPHNPSQPLGSPAGTPHPTPHHPYQKNHPKQKTGGKNSILTKRSVDTWEPPSTQHRGWCYGLQASWRAQGRGRA